MRIKENPISIYDAADELSRNGLDNFMEYIRGNLFVPSTVIILKYEDFYNDHSFLINKLLNAFNLPYLSEQVKSELIEKYRVEKAKKISDDLEKFTYYSKENQIHGNHVSENLGKPYSNDLNEAEQKLIIEYFKLYLKVFYPEKCNNE